MKKLHLNKIFHWLYAFLMFLPFIMLFCNVIMLFGNYSPSGENWFDQMVDYSHVALGNSIPFDLFENGILSDVHTSIFNFVVSLIGDDVDTTNITVSVSYLFVYWFEVSLLYLIFDVLMLPINIAHHWIDKGSDRL